MWNKVLVICLVQVTLGSGFKVAAGPKRELNEISVETVKMLDFEDEAVIDNIAKAVVETKSEEVLEHILNMLSDSEMSKSTKKLRQGLKKMLSDPQFSNKRNQKKQIPLPNGIIRLLKAKMSVDEKKNVLEQVFDKMNQIDTFHKFQAVPREARFTNKNFPRQRTGKKQDFSKCEVQPDGSCCVSKVHDKEILERDDIQECWHKNVTTCYDSYVTEFTSAQEEECEDVFYKNCVIDFKQVPFEYDIQSCITPMVKDCSGNAGGKEICRMFSETMCNTTYNDQWKPQTSCSKHPQRICAPDNCKVVPGKEKCMTKTLTSTSYKPVETCDLQPQTHCTIITKPVPQLKLVPNCYTEEKEVCRRKQGEARPAGKKTLVKWCKGGKEPGVRTKTNPADPFPMPTYPDEPLPLYGFTVSDIVQERNQNN